VDTAWLKDYQALVVGGVGFAGVIFTLWHNAKVARDRRDEERADERKALRAALVAELQINLEALRENSAKVRKDPPKEGGGLFVPTDRMDGAYRSFLPRIGLLSEGEVSAVMRAYLSLETYNAKLFLIGLPVHTSPRHVHVPAKNALALAGMQEAMVEPVEKAVKALRDAADAR
jgi:hypothetical protein